MFLFSGIFFPFSQLPGWVEAVAWLLPLYHLVEITRGMANGPDGAPDPPPHGVAGGGDGGAVRDPGPGPEGEAGSVSRIPDLATARDRMRAVLGRRRIGLVLAGLAAMVLSSCRDARDPGAPAATAVSAAGLAASARSRRRPPARAHLSVQPRAFARGGSGSGTGRARWATCGRSCQGQRVRVALMRTGPRDREAKPGGQAGPQHRQGALRPPLPGADQARGPTGWWPSTSRTSSQRQAVARSLEVPPQVPEPRPRRSKQRREAVQPPARAPGLLLHPRQALQHQDRPRGDGLPEGERDEPHLQRLAGDLQEAGRRPREPSTSATRARASTSRSTSPSR